jgi:hypothetical protein
MLYNPLKEKITRTIYVPLYYAGLKDIAILREQEGEAKEYKVTRDYEIELSFTIGAEGYTWFVIE